VCCGMIVPGWLLSQACATADAEPWTQKRLHREQTDDQGEDQPKSRSEEITHACTRTNPENLLLWPIIRVAKMTPDPLWFVRRAQALLSLLSDKRGTKNAD
jgi:hypothetical protein